MSHPEVIKKVTRSFVPVALNRLVARKAKGPAGDFFRGMEKQTPKQYQGIWIVSPEGKVLANQPYKPKGKNWATALVEVCEQGLADYGEITPRRPDRIEHLPDRGHGCRSDKSIVLVVHTRHMAAGQEPKALTEPTFDSVVLSEEERKEFELPGLQAGDDLRIDAETVRKLHKVLSPASDPNTMSRADEVTKAVLTARVSRVADGVAYLKFQGRIAGTHLHDIGVGKGKKSQAEVIFVGGGTCDAKTGKLLSICLVGEGRYWGTPPYDNVVKYGALVEWRLKR